MDCLALHEVITKFNELIFSEFSINVHKILTLSSLAMKIFKTHYMKKDTIYQLLGSIESNIRKSYTGGAVDAYIPSNRINSHLDRQGIYRKLFYYDVNSLYPTVMANAPMPVGEPVAFKGDIRKLYPDAQGIFYCNIKSPDHLEHPILQRKVKGRGTVAGLGTWTGWITSVEIDRAVSCGYQFEILKGYQFETKVIFREYVLRLYALRKSYPKSHPMNLIAKLLLNSLYGKFGMKTESTKLAIYDYNTKAGKATLDSLMAGVDVESVHDFLDLGLQRFLIVKKVIKNILSEEEDHYNGPDVNIAVAGFITGAARVYMSRFKNNSSLTGNLYYSDTDSIVTDKELPQHLVGVELGQLKLEHVVRKGVFLAPKAYILEAVNGEVVIRVKGVIEETVSHLTVRDFELLLLKDSQRELKQEKWGRDLYEGEITVKDEIYNLKVTANKRRVLYTEAIQGGEIFSASA